MVEIDILLSQEQGNDPEGTRFSFSFFFFSYSINQRLDAPDFVHDFFLLRCFQLVDLLFPLTFYSIDYVDGVR